MMDTFKSSAEPKQSYLFAQNVQLTGHQAEVFTCEFHPSGEILASGGMDRQILLWNLRSECENFGILKAHTNAITSIAFEHTGERLYSASADKAIIVWNLQTQKLMKKYRAHTHMVHSVAAPKRLMNLMASASDDGYVKVWDTRAKKITHQFLNKYPMTSVCFSEMGERLYAGGIDNNIKCWDLKTGKVEYHLEGHRDTISNLALSFDGSHLMSNSFDENIRVWDIREYVPADTRLVKVLSGHVQGSEKNLIKGSWSYDGLYIACGSFDKCAYIWDTTTRKITQQLGGHLGTINQASFHPKASILASCSNDRTILLTELPEVIL